jgi:hypothetical protein
VSRPHATPRHLGGADVPEGTLGDDGAGPVIARHGERLGEADVRAVRRHYRSARRRVEVVDVVGAELAVGVEVVLGVVLRLVAVRRALDPELGVATADVERCELPPEARGARPCRPAPLVWSGTSTVRRRGLALARAATRRQGAAHPPSPRRGFPAGRARERLLRQRCRGEADA